MINLNTTAPQLDRITREWSQLAGEPVTIQAEGLTTPWYAFGSELACLRLKNKLTVGRAAYSENLQTWYYCNK
jgi:hypothetical protein